MLGVRVTTPLPETIHYHPPQGFRRALAPPRSPYETYGLIGVLEATQPGSNTIHHSPWSPQSARNRTSSQPLTRYALPWRPATIHWHPSEPGRSPNDERCECKDPLHADPPGWYQL
ncbi:hypothetical protein FKP32DRAFT_204972 [Trametes sanguinea]|nr:hypothetical protein FKP32DRAFT_204972 [Trametes sanguinea]